MSYMIDQKICIQCGSCAPFCKNEAIRWIERHYEIDPGRCEMCGTCQQYCPMDNAIVENRMAGDKPTVSSTK